jgi:hypothetical protein
MNILDIPQEHNNMQSVTLCDMCDKLTHISKLSFSLLSTWTCRLAGFADADRF